MKKGKIFLGLIIGLLSISPTAQAVDWWEEEPGEKAIVDEIKIDNEKHQAYRVNWENGNMEVMAGATADIKIAVNQAHAVSMATKTARHLAYEKLAETVAGISIDSNSIYDRELMMDANLKTKVNALIQGAKIVKEEQKNFPDGSVWVEVILALDMNGKKGLSAPTTKWALKEGRVKEEAYLSLPEEKLPPLDEEYSGVIIDAGGLGGRPAMVPRVVTENGQVVYGEAKVGANYMIREGMTGYAGSVEKAQAQKRVGSNPLVVKALRVEGSNKSTVVVSSEDAARIIAIDAKKNILKECRVVIVLN